MVRKSVIIVVMLLYIFSNTFAHASDFPDGALIAGAYLYWASVFGANDITWDRSIKDYDCGNGEKMIETDDLSVIYCESDRLFDTQWIVLFASLHSGGTSAYNQARRLGLFASLEYGMPKSKTGNEEIDDAFKIAMEANTDCMLAMVSNTDMLYAGERVLFRANQFGRYYLSYDEKVGFIVSVE